MFRGIMIISKRLQTRKIPYKARANWTELEISIRLFGSWKFGTARILEVHAHQCALILTVSHSTNQIPLKLRTAYCQHDCHRLSACGTLKWR